MNVIIVKKDVKHINIRVKPTGEVILSAPEDADDAYIQSVISKRESWIREKQQFYKNAHSYTNGEKEFISGENFRYLGKNYRLKVIESDKNEVRLQRGYIQLFVKDRNNISLKSNLLEKWYRSNAKTCFWNIVEKYLRVVKENSVSLEVRKMKTKWGSCQPEKKKIVLNRYLIEKPLSCIEYVVFHELSHLLYPNHGKQFYNYLSARMPDWEKRKRMLEEE